MFTEQAVSFDCDGLQLNGILHPGAASAKIGVLVVVGGPQYRVGSHRQFVQLARNLASQGVPVLRFDATGMGDSAGEKRGFAQLGSDIRAAVDAFMTGSAGLEGVVLWGLCDGASAALLYAPDDPRVRGLVLLNPWLENNGAKAKTRLVDYYLKRILSGSFWRKLFSGDLDIRGSTQELGSTLHRLTARQEAIRDSEQPGSPYQLRMLEAFKVLQVPLWWLLSGNDLTAKEFERQCFGDKQWKTAATDKLIQVQRLADADHTFSRKEWQDWLAAQTLAFVHNLDLSRG